MGRIQRLPEQVANQIAAGEAVERPASVVKELIENSLDAGASAIAIEIEQGGRARIRVEDDGEGMDAEDARLALERHATSKIRSAAELAEVRTLGFRGEALPAIASVAQLTLLTAAAAEAGVRIEVEGGEIRREGPAARAVGTTVEVRNLFFNTPARAKFLRTVPTELSRIVEVVQAAALAHPAVRFRLAHDGRELFLAPATTGLEDRLRGVFGGELAAGMLPIGKGAPPLRVRGFVSRPAQARASRTLQFVFVNGRPVSDRTLSHAVAEGCRGHLPKDRFTAFAVFLELPAAEVDVNVHPAKREVRFRSPGALHTLVREALREALAAARPMESLLGGGRSEGVSEAVEAYLARAPIASPPRWRAPSPQRTADALPEQASARRVLGQIADTYIVVADDDGLLIADQHAAHERVLYDRLRAAALAGTVPVQALLFPITVELPVAAAVNLAGRVAGLAPLGFVLEPFGERAVAVREVPALLAHADLESLLRELAAELGEEASQAAQDVEHRIAALAACHAAVRAGMRLDPARCRQVVDDLLDGGHPLTCPHGRPALVRHGRRDLARAFRRP
jgi:DNA mismatch repair protein MutL